ncbi:MAG: glycosyltransferase [Pseudomonadota bacterium]
MDFFATGLIMRVLLVAPQIDPGLEDKVNFVGHTPRPTWTRIIKPQTSFCSPSIREPSGSVIFESISNGVPLVAADYGGPDARVSDAKPVGAA